MSPMDINPDALRVIRERSGIGVGELARSAGVQSAHLSNIEAGRRNASPAVARSIAKALGVPLLAILKTDAPTETERAAS